MHEPVYHPETYIPLNACLTIIAAEARIRANT